MAEICVGDIRGELVKDLGNLLERIINARKHLASYYILVHSWWEGNTLRTRAAILNIVQGGILAQRPILDTLLLEINNRSGTGRLHWCLPADMPICEDGLSKQEVAQAAESVIKTGVPLIWN